MRGLMPVRQMTVLRMAVMRMTVLRMTVLRMTVMLVGLAACREAPRHAGATGARGAVEVVPGELVVDWKDGTTKAQFDAEEKQFGIDVELNSVASAPAALTLAKGVAVTAELLARLRADPLVEHAEPVYQYRASFVPDDPEFKLQWHLSAVHAERAWEYGAGAEVVVAVIDTGVSRLPDLENTRFADGYDFVNDDPDAADDNGHGSHVAGTIAQSTHNGTGVAGLAHRAVIMPLKVLSAAGGGTTADIADAIRFAVDHGAKVLNLSLGGGGYSEVLADAVKYAHDQGAVVVCAAGNGFGPPVNYPAAYAGAFAVSAIRFDRQLAPYSSYGSEVDVAAPGGDTSVDQNGDGQPDGVLQQTLGGDYKWFQGTSMATPHVAGAAALLAGAGVTRGRAIEALLLATAAPLGDAQKFGAGALDAGAAMASVRLWGGLWRLGLAVALAFAGAWVVRRRGEKGALGAAGMLALLSASSGLLFLPLVGLGHPAPAAFAATPMPEWGMVLSGAQQSSPLWLSAFVPFLLMGVARVRWLSGTMAGAAFGWAAYLVHAAATGWVDVAWVPGRGLEFAWLAVNGLLAFGFATLALRAREQGLAR